jgi:hypothetical protein
MIALTLSMNILTTCTFEETIDTQGIELIFQSSVNCLSYLDSRQTNLQYDRNFKYRSKSPSIATQKCHAHPYRLCRPLYGLRNNIRHNIHCRE